MRAQQPTTPSTANRRPMWRRRVGAGLSSIAVGAALLIATAPAASAVPEPQPDWRLTETLTTSKPSPRAITLSPDGALAYTSHEDDGTVGVLSLADGPLIDLPVDDFIAEPLLTVPADDGYRVLVAGTNDVSSVTPSDWSIDGFESPGVEAFARSAATGLVYSIDGGLQLSERDPVTGALLRFALLDEYLITPALAAHPTQPVLYATNAFDGGYVTGTVTAIDLDLVDFMDPCACSEDDDDTGGSADNPYTVLEILAFEPIDAAMSLDGATLYVLGTDGVIAEIRTSDFTLVGTHVLSSGFTPSASLSVNPVTGEVIAADMLGSIDIFDPATSAISRVSLAEGLWDTAVSTDGTKILVTNTWEGTVSILERRAPAPGPATDVTATGGARQAWVTWTASPTVDPDLTYSVTVDNAVVCTTTTTSCFVTGLTPGSVEFTVVTTAAGGSAPSLPSTPVTITAPEAPASVPTTPTPGTSIGFVGEHPATATTGQQVQVIAEGFAPGTYVDVSLHSLPMLLGSGLVGTGGTATITVTIPAGAPPGAHHLVASGFTAAGQPAAAVRPITLAAAQPGTDTLPRTGAPDAGSALWAGTLLLASGAALTLLRRRRTA